MLQREPSGPARECFVHRDTAENSSEGEVAEIQLISNALIKGHTPKPQLKIVCEIMSALL